MTYFFASEKLYDFIKSWSIFICKFYLAVHEWNSIFIAWN